MVVSRFKLFLISNLTLVNIGISHTAMCTINKKCTNYFTDYKLPVMEQRSLRVGAEPEY